MTTTPWTSGVLPRKFIELVGVGLNAACTNLNPDGTRRHIRAALQAGATRDELLFVLKCAFVMSIHSCALGAPILLEEAKAAGNQPAPKPAAATPACDKMKSMRDEKVKVLKAMRPLDPKNVVRGQFRGYRNERGVAPGSQTETFAALRLGASAPLRELQKKFGFEPDHVAAAARALLSKNRTAVSNR
jgi:hypothetical protein